MCAELGGFDDVFGDDSNGDGGPAAPKLCPKQPKKYHASAPSDSDEDEGEEESENGDSEDDGLRGLSDSDDGGTSEEEESEEDGLDGLLSSDTDREADDAGLNLLDQSSEEESSGDDAGEASSDGDTASGDDKTADASAVEKLPKARKQETRPTNGRIAADTPAEGGGTAEKYVPPAVRRAQLAAAGAADHREAEVTLRRVRGLLNRLAEANLQGIVG